MAGWILTIQKELPHHLDYAVDEGFWDCTSNSGIQEGDDLFFWQAGASLVAHCVATGSPYPIDEDVPKPWDDRQVRPYTHRIPLRLLSRDVAEPPRWKDLQEEIGSRARASNGIVPIKDPSGAPRVQQRFRYAPEFFWPPAVTDFEAELEQFDIPPDQDTRRSAVRSIMVRRGQPQFRGSLLRGYNGRCVVTGSGVEQVLEAAHISPYRGDETNDPRNGLLLRADIHTMFDLNLLTVLPDLTVRLAPELRSSCYGSLDGAKAKIDGTCRLRPSRQMLERHNANCRWLD